MNTLSPYIQYLLDVNRQVRVVLRLIIEALATFFVYVFWLTSTNNFETFPGALHLFNASIWLVAYKILGLSEDQIRFSSLKSYISIFKLSFIIGAIFCLEYYVVTGTLQVLPSLFAAVVILNLIVGIRISARQLIRKHLSRTRTNVLVYGTTDVAIDLVNAMTFGKKYNAIAFISNTSQESGSLAGLPIILMDSVQEYANTHDCKLVILAIEKPSAESQKDILLHLDKLGLSVSYAPTIDRAFDYEVQLKVVKPEDVLGRQKAAEFDGSIYEDLRKKTVLVTGGGGSIGSEICRQILRYQPEKLIALELNEFALYNLEQELSSYSYQYENSTTILYHLGSINDEATLNKIFKEYNIHIIYHAAAYKHVPIIENNIISGIQNNVFGTKALADFADSFGVEKFVLVSTDKAVRPTNVMGASKRLAELIVQDLAKSSNTVFTMVRFGNVLGSSGSVIPKFKSQIKSGGPVTVTHAEITRYFMSIPEAAHLVITAGTLAEGGEVFLLNMGDPIKIIDLAKSMVRQHGLQPVLRSENQQRNRLYNEIEIEFSGLRPGEKLYEELLVDGISTPTSNPKIFRSLDGTIEDLDLSEALLPLEKALDSNLTSEILKCLRDLPLLYEPDINKKPEDTRSSKVENARMITDDAETDKTYSVLTLTNQDRPSFMKNIIASKLGHAMLHCYFRMTRSMTLGVRVLVKNHKGEILLVRHSYVPGWHLPGGGVDHGEDALAAARREVFEETGISELNDLQFISLDLNKAASKRDHVAYFTARTSQIELIKPTSEISDVRFVPNEIAMEIMPPKYKKFVLEN